MNSKAGRKKGSVLTLTLLVMTVGSIVMAVFFQYLGASLALAIRGEENANTYYAADSGFEDGFYWLQQGKELGGFWAWSEGEEQWERENYEINDRTVQVGVEDTGDDIYKITSRAICDEGKNTVIESYVRTYKDNYLATFGDSAISSNCDGLPRTVRIMSDTVVTGNISVPDGDESLVTFDDTATHNGEIVALPELWPTAEKVTSTFLPLVDTSDPYLWELIDVDATPDIGPLYREGNLEIWSTVKGQSYASLNGNVYVTGNLEIADTGRDFTLNLSGHAIFVEGYIDVKDRCTLERTGSIIALGDVFFGPKMDSSGDDFMFIMSVEGGVQLNPNGVFYGSIVGHDEVRVQPGAQVEWTGPGSAGYVLPSIDAFKILTYKIVD